MSPSTQERKHLECRAERLIRSLSGTRMSSPADITPKTGIVLLAEGCPPKMTYRWAIQPNLHLHGLHLDGLEEMLAEIAADPKDDGIRYPVLICIGGWMQVCWQDCPTLSPGGLA